MNDRTGATPASGDMQLVEWIVGAVHGAAKGQPPEHVFAGLCCEYAKNVGRTLPVWVTESLVAHVQERMRQLVGRWRATPWGGSMEL